MGCITVVVYQRKQESCTFCFVSFFQSFLSPDCLIMEFDNGTGQHYYSVKVTLIYFPFNVCTHFKWFVFPYIIDEQCTATVGFSLIKSINVLLFSRDSVVLSSQYSVVILKQYLHDNIFYLDKMRNLPRLPHLVPGFTLCIASSGNGNQCVLEKKITLYMNTYLYHYV